MAVRFTIEMDNAFEVAERFDTTRRRIEDHEPAYRQVMALMEQDHRRFFELQRIYRDKARFGQRRYVRTGRTRRSLVQNGPDALREVHATGLDFGTRVPYARFLTKAPKDRNLGQVPKRNGRGRSAVVVFPRRTQRAVRKILLDYITEPVTTFKVGTDFRKPLGR